MKSISTLLTAIVCLVSLASAQNTTVHLSLKNSTATSCYLWIPEYSLLYGYLKKGAKDIPLDQAKNGTYKIELSKPIFALLAITDKDGNDARQINYRLYLSPGDQLTIIADLQGDKFTVTGKGGNNNQQLLAAIQEPSLRGFYGDTIPNRVISAVNKYHADLQTAFAQYKKAYEPSADFINNETENIRYAALYSYYNFKENNKYQIWKVYPNHIDAWTKVQDSLFNGLKLDNNNAIIADNYLLYLRTFVMREKERLWQESYKNPVTFYKEWYNADTASGKKLFTEDEQNRLQQKIVQKYFTGAVQEYGYALVLDDALGSHNPQNVVAIFDDFKKAYPGSKYVKWFGPAIDTIRQQEKQPLSKEMVLAPGNGSNLNAFADVLALAKGKTVLLDMWGTWCGPCRNEISENGAAIKAYFKDKGLDYFYVANRDIGHEDAWKKLIAYFNMTGTHILANTTLSKDIMNTVKGTGYPTYIIIKKDGTWELSKAGYPMKRDMMIQQLNEALAMK